MLSFLLVMTAASLTKRLGDNHQIELVQRFLNFGGLGHGSDAVALDPQSPMGADE